MKEKPFLRYLELMRDNVADRKAYPFNIPAIAQLVQAGSQFVVSTHSPILLAYPNATIYLLDRTGTHKTRYEDTEHYAVTRDFLQDPAERIRQLFEESEDDE